VPTHHERIDSLVDVLRPIAALALVALLAGCAGSRPSWTYAPTVGTPPAVTASAPPPTPAITAQPATPAPTQAPSPVPTKSGTITVTLTDTMRIDPGLMTMSAGQAMTFVVTNTGSIVHEFTLGSANIQDEHEEEMMETGGMPMAHDEDNAISVAPGQTKTLTFTFDMPGTYFAGCHVMDHYAAGMKATISVI
jgi:uncharacterized cupredoxin-like copper-binding protein